MQKETKNNEITSEKQNKNSQKKREEKREYMLKRKRKNSMSINTHTKAIIQIYQLK